MRSDSLHLLLRLRKQALEIASRNLSECIQAETAATHAVRSQAGEMDHQRRTVEAAGADDSDVETFGKWFTMARARLGNLSANCDRAAVQTARARAELMAARTAMEVVEALLQDRRLAAAEEEARHEQNQSDDRAVRPGHTQNRQ